MKTTLLGLLIVAWIAGSLLYSPSGSLCAKKENRIRMDVATLISALNALRNDAGTYPTTEQGLAALVREPEEAPGSAKRKATMKQVITDPWAREYRYRQPGLHNPATFDLWSLGPDGIESEDDIGNWD